jgi:hypothetical protein
MPSWFDGAVVAVLVGVAIFWGGRAIYRSLKKGNVCSTCGDSQSCPLAGKETPLTDLQDYKPGPGKDC